MKFLSLILRSLFRSRLRTVLTLAFITLSVFLVALMQGFLGTIDSLTTSTASGSRLVVQDKASFTNTIPESYGNFLRGQPEVEAVTQFQWFGGEYKDPKNFFANFAVQKDSYLKVYREEAGLNTALEVVRHHRLVESFLSEALGYRWDEVHAEAHRLEHAISEELEERMARKIQRDDQQRAHRQTCSPVEGV